MDVGWAVELINLAMLCPLTIMRYNAFKTSHRSLFNIRQMKPMKYQHTCSECIHFFYGSWCVLITFTVLNRMLSADGHVLFSHYDDWSNFTNDEHLASVCASDDFSFPYILFRFIMHSYPILVEPHSSVSLSSKWRHDGMNDFQNNHIHAHKWIACFQTYWIH